MLSRRIFCASVAVLLWVGGGQAQVGTPLTVEQLVELALQRNRDFLALKQRLNEAQGLLRRAAVRPAPTLEFEGGTGRPLGTTGEEEFAAGYFHLIETAGKRPKRVQVAEKSVALVEAEILDRARQLAFEVRTQYADAVAEQQRLQTLKRLLAVSQDYSRLTEARVQRGDAAPLELQLLAVDLGRMEAQQAIFTGRSQSSLLELKRFVGLSPSETLVLSQELVSSAAKPSLPELQSRALAKRPDLQTAQTLEEQAAAEMSLAQAEAWPDLTVSLSYSRRNSRVGDLFGISAAGAPAPLHDRDDILAFGFSLPLFSAKRNLGNIEAAVSRMAAARLRREHLEIAIPLEVEAAYTRWIASRDAVKLLTSGVVEQSERNLQVIRQAYSLGQLRMLDVLNEQRRLLDTQLALVDAQVEEMKSLSELERVVGENLP